VNSAAHSIANRDGWLLSLYQSFDPERLVSGRPPVLIVPGYGMNSYIFSYHPRGLSLEGFLAQAGFEVWRVDLRGQGRSRAIGGGDRYRLADLALTDLPAAIDGVLERTRTGAGKVHLIGASLGGTLIYLYAALRRDPRIGAIVAMGSPVRWVEIHPALRLAFSSPFLAGLVRVRGTRRLAEVVLPRVLRHVPWLLAAYINPAITDLEATSEMVKTVEDPNRHINREIAHWICDRDLIVRGTNLSEAIAAIDRPLLCVLASHDGIVPRETALFPYHRVASARKAILEVGAPSLAVAHADLFVSNEAHERVFRPIASWLAEMGD
jgi:pimeloyl-ACP methyl ester carboxylesterase